MALTESTAEAHPSSLDAWIVSTPGTLGGKPRVNGHRIAVEHIKNWILTGGLTPEQVSAEYDLPLEAVYAAMAYYYSHKQAIDAHEAKMNALIDQMMKSTEEQVTPPFGQATRSQ